MVIDMVWVKNNEIDFDAIVVGSDQFTLKFKHNKCLFIVCEEPEYKTHCLRSFIWNRQM